MARARFCKNPDCERKGPFSPKSDGAKFCCVPCKNRSNYIDASMEFTWEALRIAERKRNRKILEYLFGIGQLRVARDTLLQLGFTFEVVFLPVIDDEEFEYFRFGNSYLKQVDENHFEISYIND